jgi:outer membrane protein assembly factor BamB
VENFRRPDIVARKEQTMQKLLVALALALTVLTHPGTAQAAELTSGNILVSDQFSNTLTEFTPAGVPVQSFVFPVVDFFTDLRDIVADVNGNVHAYNGTFEVEMQTLDPVLGTIASQTLAGWSTVNNISYGGIAVLGDSVFATDMATAGTGAPQGIVRFSLAGDAPVRFATSAGYINLTIGWNGLLYAVRTNGNTIDVFDPASEALLGSIDLDFTLQIADVRGVAVDADGTLYLAAWNGSLYSADSDGNTLKTLATGFSDLTDIDLNASGILLVGSRFGNVILSDVDLESVSSFNAGTTSSIRVAFTDPLVLPDDEDGAAIEVLVDIKPGSDENPVNLKGSGKTKGKAPAAGGVLPVAILSTEDFDAASTNVDSLLLGDPELPGAVPPIKSSLEDVNGDGIDDLVLHFSLRELTDFDAIDADTVWLVLTGETDDGTAIEGVDFVTIKP